MCQRLEEGQGRDDISKYDYLTNYCSVIHQANLHSLKFYVNHRFNFSISELNGEYIEYTKSGS